MGEILDRLLLAGFSHLSTDIWSDTVRQFGSELLRPLISRDKFLLLTES